MRTRCAAHVPAIALALFALPSCGELLQDLSGGTFQSNMVVDGHAWAPAQCVSGDLETFRGVDLIDSSGSKIRLVKEVDGSPTMILFAPGAEVGATIRDCLSLRLEHTGVRVNNIRVVKGAASFRCVGPEGQRIVGDITFRCGIP